MDDVDSVLETVLQREFSDCNVVPYKQPSTGLPHWIPASMISFLVFVTY
jgi:hypothetical protein